MKHKWTPNNYYRGPHYWPGSQYCTECGTTWTAPCDPLDSEAAAKYMKKQFARDDCPGNKNIKKTVVVNRHYKSYDVYIGRGTKFGNDYRIGPDGTREDVIAKHKKDFYNNPELQEAVWHELRGQRIGCSCKPLACHGDTYVEYIENRERLENETS